MIEKINLFTDLSDKEKAKLPKFYPSLGLVTKEELESTLKAMRSNGASITKASDIKVAVNSSDEINNKHSIMEQIGEEKVFAEDVSRYNINTIEIYKRISYCLQNNIGYKNDDGTYKKFLFNTALWKKEIEQPVVAKTSPVEEVSNNEPIKEEKKVDNKDNVVTFPSEPEIEELKDESPIIDNNLSEDKSSQKSEYESIRNALEETRKALAEQFLTFGDIDDQELNEGPRRAA